MIFRGASLSRSGPVSHSLSQSVSQSGTFLRNQAPIQFGSPSTSKTLHDPTKSLKIHEDPSKSCKIHEDPSRSSRSFKILQDHSRSFMFLQYPSISFKIFQYPSRSFKILHNHCPAQVTNNPSLKIISNT